MSCAQAKLLSGLERSDINELPVAKIRVTSQSAGCRFESCRSHGTVAQWQSGGTTLIAGSPVSRSSKSFARHC